MNTSVRTVTLTVAAAVAAALLGFAVTLGTGFGDRSEAADNPSAPASQRDGHPVNRNGDTYGPTSGGDVQPDLVRVLADDGVTVGYAYRADLGGPGGAVTTPQEAEEYMQSDAAQHGYTVPVYETDGETQIGTFTVQGFQDIEEAKRAHPNGVKQSEDLRKDLADRIP